MKSFDEQFSQSVKNAFGGYNADALSDEGWKAYAKKYGKTSRFTFAIPMWAKAASVAIIIAVGAYTSFEFAKRGDKIQNIAYAPTANELKSTEKIDTTPIDIATDKTEQKSNSTHERNDRVAESKVSLSKSMVEEIAKSTEDEVDITQTLTSIDLITPTSSEESFGEGEQIAFHQVTEETIQIDVSKIDSKENPITLPMGFIVDTEIKPSDKTTFSAGVTGMLAVVESMLSSSAGMAVGFYAEHKLTDKLAIRPGLAVAKHAFGLDSQRLMNNSPSLSHDELSPTIVSTASNISIVAMEIPVNLVLTIFKRKDRNIYISAGASSMLYLDQQFSGTFQETMSGEYFDSATGTWNENYSSVTVEIENQYSAFSHTDLFGLANLSLGIAFPMGSNSLMLVEPFIQLPTTRLTSSNLHMGFGGVMLRYQFGKKGM